MSDLSTAAKCATFPCTTMTILACDDCEQACCSRHSRIVGPLQERLCSSCEQKRRHPVNRDERETHVSWLARQGLLGRGGVR